MAEENEGKLYTEDDLEEAKRKWMEEQGLLTTEAGLPSGSFGDWENLRLKYGEGTATKEERATYLRMRRERGR